MVKQRVIVYIDGFNFYYGLKRNSRWKRYYWIDFVRLFESFMKPHQELVAVKYFSAKPISNEDKAERQSLLFKANEENPKFQLVLGKYLQKSLTCKNCGYKITTYEEKESDVRIATQIVRDAFEKSCDVAIVVSADSDMNPAVGRDCRSDGNKLLSSVPALKCPIEHQPRHHENGTLRASFQASCNAR